MPRSASEVDVDMASRTWPIEAPRGASADRVLNRGSLDARALAQLEPPPRARELPRELALPRERGLQRVACLVGVRLGGREPVVERVLFGRRARSMSLLDRRLPATRAACARPRAAAAPRASSRFCACDRRPRALPASARSSSLRAPAAIEHPVAIVVEIAVERRDLAVGDEPQLVGGRAQQVPVVRDDDQRAVVVLQRFGQRLAHLDVEVVGRLVEQQQVRALRARSAPA